MSLRLLTLLSALFFSVSALAQDGYRYPTSTRIVVVGDIHGADDALVKTLHAAKLIDAGQHWIGGDATLVSVGDLLDRGPDVRKVLDLLMRLEGEALAAGGRVHVLSGNHELMNLGGELRDTTSADFAAFAGDETSDERERAFAIWRTRQTGAAMAGDTSLDEFNRRFPPGWFARRRAFAPDGHYGLWLLGNPITIVVGDSAFVHGGLSRAIADYDLAQLNDKFRAGLASYLKAVSLLETAGWIDFSVPGENRAQVVEAYLQAQTPGAGDSVLVAAAKTIIAFDSEPLFGEPGPLWYRGLAMCRTVTEQDVADAALTQFGVKRVVVGHTPTPTLRPTLRLQSKVLMVDTGMLKATYGGRGHAVVIDANGLRAIDQDGTDVALVVDDRPSGMWLPGGSDDALQTQLLAAQPAPGTKVHDERTEVSLVYQGQTLHGWFFANRTNDERELAAYRLDRLLGLGLVPVTVTREFNGKHGALQWHPEQIAGSAEVGNGSARISPWCAVQPQFELVRVWDALLANEGRTMASLNWEPNTATLLSSDHRRAFGTRKRLSSQYTKQKLQVGPELCRRLASLERESLARALGTSLSEKEQVALLKRRDRIVDAASCAGDR